jgi:hypothetical protein
VETRPEPVKFKAPVAVSNINPPAVLTWYETFLLQLQKTFGAVGLGLLLLLILYVIYRFLRQIGK